MPLQTKKVDKRNYASHTNVRKKYRNLQNCLNLTGRRFYESWFNHK